MDESMHRAHAQLEDTHWWFVGKNRIVLGLIDRFAPKAAGERRPRLCDLGCGAGGLIALLASRFEVVGVECSPIALANARRRGLDVRAGSLPDGLPFDARRGEVFDVVVMSEVLEHVEDDRRAAAAAVDLLAPGGLLVCTVPAHPWLWSRHDEINHHHRRYTRRSLEAVFASLPVEAVRVSHANAVMFPALAVVRVGGRMRGRGAGRAGGRAEPVRMPPRVINAALRGVFSLEARVIPRLGLPWGSTLAAAYRKAN